MGNRPVLTRTRQPAGAAGAHLCAPPAPTQQHTGVWDTCRNTSPANLCHEPLLRPAQRPSQKGASTASIVLGEANLHFLERFANTAAATPMAASPRLLYNTKS
jgi:hypothetical protein